MTIVYDFLYISGLIYCKTHWTVFRPIIFLQITIPTLEQLLNHPNQYSLSENMSSQHSVKSFQEVRNVQPNQLAGLQSALTNQQRRVEYLSELLSESETNVTRLFEQNKVSMVLHITYYCYILKN